MHGSVAHRSRSARENREKSQESQGHPRPLKVWDQRKLKTLPKDTISWRQRLTQPHACLTRNSSHPRSNQTGCAFREPWNRLELPRRNWFLPNLEHRFAHGSIHSLPNIHPKNFSPPNDRNRMIDLGTFRRHYAASVVQDWPCIKGTRNGTAVVNFLHHGILPQDGSVLRDGRIGISIEAHARLAEGTA